MWFAKPLVTQSLPSSPHSCFPEQAVLPLPLTWSFVYPAAMPAPYPISLLANSSNNSWPPIPLFPGSLPGQPPTLTPGNSPLSSLQFPRALITPSRTPVSSFSPFSKLWSPKWQSWCLVMFNAGSPNVTGPGTEHSVNVLKERTVLVYLLTCHLSWRRFLTAPLRKCLTQGRDYQCNFWMSSRLYY